MLLPPALLLVTSLASPPAAAAVPEVRVLRDPHGVPHVLATTDHGAGYGHGWAVAEDQLVPALSAYWTAQGRRTEIDGADALPLDRAIRLLRVTSKVEETFARCPREVKDVARGFADGFNAYMAAHPDEVPAWAEPIEPEWPLGLGRMIQFIPQIRDANGEMGGRKGRMSVLASGPDKKHYDIYGSNAWVLGPSRTAGGASLMLTDPHLPWKHEFRLYEVHMRGATFEVAGAAFLGVPIPAFGRNDRVSWAWTWNNPDHVDVYRLKLEGESRYRFDGRAVKFERERHEFRLPDGGALTETLEWSKHGPVTYKDVDEGYALAPRLTVFELTDVATQMLAMIRARTVDDLNRAMAMQQIPHFNLVMADVDGAIEYVYGGRVPDRSKLPADIDWDRPVDGTTKKTLWSHDEFIPWEEMPRTRDPAIGFVQSCNNHPDFTTETDADPPMESWPPRVVSGGERDSMRAWHLRRRIAERERWTEEQAMALALDNYVIPHRLVAHLRRAWETFGDTFPGRDDIAKDVERLLEWDGYPTRASAAMTMCLVWLWDAFDQTVMLPTELLERDVDALDDEYMMKLLVGMVEGRQRLDEMAPFPVVPWGLLHVVRKNGTPYPVESGMYPAISLWNANLDLSGGLTDITGRVGSAYTAFTVMEQPMRTYSITPLGQTDDERRPYCRASTITYAKRELKFLPFTDAQLAEVETTETILRP